MPHVSARVEFVVHKAEEGGYWAEAPSLPGCFTQGETLIELRRNMQEAVDLYLGVATPKAKATKRAGGQAAAPGTKRAKSPTRKTV